MGEHIHRLKHLFSALIKNSTTRKLLLEYEGSFLFPEFIFEEMEKHKTIWKFTKNLYH